MNKLYTSLNNFTGLFWSKVVASTGSTAASLSVFRIITGLFLLLLSFDTFGWLKVAPQSFFSPPGISVANLFNGFPKPYVFFTIDLILLIGAVCITLGIKAKLSTLIYACANIFGLSFQYSFGKIDHSIMLFVTMFCMAFSGWGSKLAIIPDREPNQKTVDKCTSLLAVMLCFGFFSAGLSKALNWVNFNPNVTGVASWYYPGYYTFGRHFLLAPYFIHVPLLGLKIMDFAAVLFELSPIFFLLWSPKAWRVFLIVAVAFHLTNLLVLNIGFLTNAIAYLAFVNYGAAQNWLQQKLSNKFFKLTLAMGLLAIVLIRLVDNILSFSPGSLLLIHSDDLGIVMILWVILWVLTGIIIVLDYLARDRESIVKAV